MAEKAEATLVGKLSKEAINTIWGDEGELQCRVGDLFVSILEEKLRCLVNEGQFFADFDFTGDPILMKLFLDDSSEYRDAGGHLRLSHFVFDLRNAVDFSIDSIRDMLHDSPEKIEQVNILIDFFRESADRIEAVRDESAT